MTLTLPGADIRGYYQALGIELPARREGGRADLDHRPVRRRDQRARHAVADRSRT